MGRNNKKKNKGKPAETSKGLSVGNGEISLAENRDTASEQNYLKQNSSDGESLSVGLQESDAELNLVNGVGGEKNVKLPEEEEMITWSNKETEVQLQEELKSLKEDVRHQEELKSLKEDVRICFQKEADLEKTIEQLQSERDVYTQKEAIRGVKLEELQNEVNTCLLTEAMWGAKLEELQNEVNTCLLTEANLKEQLRILGEESSFKEASTKESILILENTNKMLQEKVIDLEEFREHLVQENQLLISSISLLQARVQKLEESSLVETKKEKSDSPKEENTTCRVMEDHSAEELVVGCKDIFEKEKEPQDLAANDNLTISLSPEHGSTNEPDKELTRANHLAGHDESSAHAFESIPIHDAMSREYLSDQLSPLYVSRSLAQHSSEDEIQVEEVNNQPGEIIEESNTPLSDAPLIGAPFRLISFMAKYVSGADLVKDQGSKFRR